MGNGADYGTPAAVGDKIKMKIDLREGQNNVEFFRNGNSMGLAFGGLGDWQNIYIGMSGRNVGDSFRIVEYKVI